MRNTFFSKKNSTTYIKIAGIILFFGFTFFAGNRIGNFLLTKKYQQVAPGESNAPSSSCCPSIAGLPKVPSPEASDAEKSSFAIQVHQVAQAVTSVHVRKTCALDPSVIRAAEGNKLTFANDDEVMHRLGIGLSNIEIASKEQKTINAQFQNGAGIYGIACDGATVGFIEVTPKGK